MAQTKKPRGARGGSEASASTQVESVPEVQPLALERSAEVSARAQAKRAAKRRGVADETGFSTESISNISALQAKWIASKAHTGSEVAACLAVGVALEQVARWFDDADFVALHDEMMENRREGFKSLSTQMLPQALLTLMGVMEHGEKDADKIKAATLVLRNQGLLLDRIQTIDHSALATLLSDLRSPRPVIKALPSPTNATSQEANQ